jgi:hypothetical protein
MDLGRHDMSKGDIKLLITGVVSLFLAMVMAVITIVVFAFGLGGKIKEVDWNKTFGDVRNKIETPAN